MVWYFMVPYISRKQFLFVHSSQFDDFTVSFQIETWLCHEGKSVCLYGFSIFFPQSTIEFVTDDLTNLQEINYLVFFSIFQDETGNCQSWAYCSKWIPQCDENTLPNGDCCTIHGNSLIMLVHTGSITNIFPSLYSFKNNHYHYGGQLVFHL